MTRSWSTSWAAGANYVVEARWKGIGSVNDIGDVMTGRIVIPGFECVCTVENIASVSEE
jgi:hypothetical protein